MIPSGGGKFEITIDGEVVYSKLAEGRFPENAEVIGLIESHASKVA